MANFNKPKEKDYQAKILSYLRKTYPDGFIWKNQAGPYAQAGVPDILALINGRFIAIEVKRPGGKLSELQKRAIAAINAAGGYAGMAVTVLDAQAILEAAGVFPAQDPRPDPVTLRDLSQLYYLKKEIALSEERLDDLKSQEGPKAASVSGAAVSGGSDEHGQVERLSVQIVALEQSIDKKRDEIFHERLRLERYINTIPDSLTRMIFTLRFVECLRWDDVAEKIGGRNTGESVKKCCYRYVDKIAAEAKGCDGSPLDLVENVEPA